MKKLLKTGLTVASLAAMAGAFVFTSTFANNDTIYKTPATAADYYEKVDTVISQQDWEKLSMKQIDEKLVAANIEPMGQADEPLYTYTPEQIDQFTEEKWAEIDKQFEVYYAAHPEMFAYDGEENIDEEMMYDPSTYTESADETYKQDMLVSLFGDKATDATLLKIVDDYESKTTALWTDLDAGKITDEMFDTQNDILASSYEKAIAPYLTAEGKKIYYGDINQDIAVGK